MQKRTGFTLIELLVVIAIIAILAAVAIIQFGSAQADARDARRQADARAMQSALELQFNASDAYPAANTWTNLMNALGDFLPSVIQDPDSSVASFYYCKSSENENYLLGVTLEDPAAVSGDLDTLVGWGNGAGEDNCIRENGDTVTLSCADGGSGSIFCLGDANDN